MGKFFGLLACIGTAVVVSGCVKVAQPKKYEPQKIEQKSAEQIMSEIMNSPENAELKRTLQLIQEATNSCNTPEAKQKISVEAEANTVNKDIVADVQDVSVVNAQCSGKDVLNEKVVSEANGSVVITGAQVADVISSVEIESDRTCVKLVSSLVVSDVAQSPIKDILILEADGDIQLPLSNSLRKNHLAMNISEGKNLLKIKYFKCDSFIDVIGADGVSKQTCEKKTQVASKELVLNMVITKNVIEGARVEEGCPKKEEKPKTDGQE